MNFPASISALGNQIGRYFSLTALFPSFLFVAWCLAMVSGGHPLGSFNLSDAIDGLTSWSTEKALGIFAITVVVAFAVHPFIFSTTQALEGYWGARRFAVRLAALRSLRYRRQQDQLEDAANRIRRDMRRLLDVAAVNQVGHEAYGSLTDPERADLRSALRALPAGEGVHWHITARSAILKALERFPHDADRVMPTRLGNTLRRVEDETGKQYGLDLIKIAPHLVLASDVTRNGYINDSREQMDVCVRLTFFGLVACAASVLWLLGAGWWLCLSSAPLLFAYTSYRGAVASAADWGAAMATAVDLDRFQLYEAMSLAAPSTTEAERQRNRLVMKLLAGDRTVHLDYRR